jgi:hypothetical protein
VSPKPDTATDSCKGRADLLSADEEAVLAGIREIVRRVRDESGTANLHGLAGRVTDAGATRVDRGRNGIVEFRRGAVCFFIRSVLSGRFEINFSPSRAVKTVQLALIIGTIGTMSPARCESAWTYVPASHDGRALDSYSVAEVPTDKVVTVVGAGNRSPRRGMEPLRVFALEFPAPSGVVREHAPLVASRDEYPEGARWPDASGRIAAPPSFPNDHSRGLRNPWEVRVHAGPAGGDTVFLCGGIVVGGDGGPIAIVNGRVVRKGDALGRFAVARVLPAGVVLERNGAYFVIPRGKRTAISAEG